MYAFLKSRNRKISLRLVLVVPFVLQIFTAVGLTGWISLRNGQKAVNNLADRLRVEASDRVATHLDGYLATPQQINQINSDAIELGLLNLEDLPTTGRFFWKQMQIFDVGYINFASSKNEFIGVERLDDGTLLINETTLASTQTMSIYETDRQGNRQRLQSIEPVEDSVHLEEWYAAAVEAKHPVWSKIYQWDDKPILSISSSYPIYDKTHRLVGVIGVDLILSQISAFLNGFKLSPSSRTFILERNGMMVASCDLKQPFEIVNGETRRIQAVESHDPLIQATGRYLRQYSANLGGSLGGSLDSDLSQIHTSQQLQFDFKGENQFVRVKPWHDRGLDWLIVVVVPESDFMDTINANTRTTIFLCLVSLAIAILLSLITSRLLIKQILNMIGAAEALSGGNWQQQVSEPRAHELALLAKAFNRMAGHLQTSFTQLEHNANHDALTGLLNAMAFKVKLEEAIASSSNHQFAVLFLDLDHFKLVNDSLGHLIGDQLLIEVTQRLADCIRQSDTLARFGGDEFIILLNPILSSADAAHVADRILQVLQRPFTLNGHEVFISTSVGIALNNSGAESPEAYLQKADTALYHAKAKGKAGYEIFDARMHTEAVSRLKMETDLQRALERQELEVYYQPILEIASSQLVGFEALLRWHHPLLGMVAPATFIPIAEETGLIVKLGWWVLQQACQQMKTWQQQEGYASMTISVNLSYKQFVQADLLEQIERILNETGLLPQYLKLEITESLFMNHSEATRFKLRRLRNHGIHLSIDDFGTGYSSLSYLQRFPVDTLKIDRSFIHHLGTSSENSAIVEAITVMAHKLSMNVVAEGVETMEQLECLRAIGCEQVQGYLFSPPKAAHEAALLLHPDSKIQNLEPVETGL